MSSRLQWRWWRKQWRRYAVLCVFSWVVGLKNRTKLEKCFEKQAEDDYFEPQIALITLIFNELRILQMKFKCASAKIPQIGWRMKRNLLHNLLFNLLRIYSLPPCGRWFFEPQITQITLISNKLQIIRLHGNFKCALRQAAVDPSSPKFLQPSAGIV